MASTARPNPSDLLRRAVAALKSDAAGNTIGEGPRDYEQGLCMFCGLAEPEGHSPTCPWPEMEAEAALPDQLQTDVAYMPVPRCSACRWWKPFPADLQPQELLSQAVAGTRLAGVPDLALDLADLGDCQMFECRDFQQVNELSKLIVTRTVSGQAVIATHADFGCVQFEPTPAAEAHRG